MDISALLIDRLDSLIENSRPQRQTIISRSRRILATTPHNMTALRSGQYWEEAMGEQLDDYHESLQPKLLAGMRYLTENKEKNGTMALRVMTNLNEDGSDRAETSVLAYFMSLKQLEGWAKSHCSHLALYRHAVAMNRKYKGDRTVVTWHELFVIPQKMASMEYINCHPLTGLLPYPELLERKP